MSGQCAIVVLAKAPVPGFAKTRLAAGIGAQAAARLAARMLSESVAQAVAAGVGPVELACAPDCSHPRFAQEQKRHGLTLAGQGEGGLGERMWRALDRALGRHRRALLIGTDAPRLDAASLARAAAALTEHDAVFAPAFDGGYVMVGLSRPLPGLFDGIDWSTPQVMEQTRRRLSALGASWTELESFHDIDQMADLAHVPTEWLSS